MNDERAGTLLNGKKNTHENSSQDCSVRSAGWDVAVLVAPPPTIGALSMSTAVIIKLLFTSVETSLSYLRRSPEETAGRNTARKVGI